MLYFADTFQVAIAKEQDNVKKIVEEFCQSIRNMAVNALAIIDEVIKVGWSDERYERLSKEVNEAEEVIYAFANLNLFRKEVPTLKWDLKEWGRYDPRTTASNLVGESWKIFWKNWEITDMFIRLETLSRQIDSIVKIVEKTN